MPQANAAEPLRTSAREIRNRETTSSEPQPYGQTNAEPYMPKWVMMATTYADVDSTDEHETLLTQSRRDAEDGQVDEEPRSSYHDPHQSRGLQGRPGAGWASGRGTAKRLPRPSPKPRTPGETKCWAGKWTRNREAIITTPTKAKDSRRRPSAEWASGRGPRRGYHDPHRSRGLQGRPSAGWASGRGTAKRLPRPSPKPRTPGGDQVLNGQVDEDRDTVTTTLTKAEDSRGDQVLDGQVDTEPRSGYRDPHQSHVLQEEAPADTRSTYT
jgi:hypothetical protein